MPSPPIGPPDWAPEDERDATWRWVLAQTDWEIGGNGLPCRAGGGGTRPTCGQPAVARLWRSRGRGRVQWAYCAEHLYGRVLHDGVLWLWEPLPAGEQ